MLSCTTVYALTLVPALDIGDLIFVPIELCQDIVTFGTVSKQKCYKW